MIRTLGRKEDGGVFQMERSDGSPFVLRIYRYAVPACESLCGHTCEVLPGIFSTGWREGYFVVEEEYVDGISLQEMIEGGTRMSPERTIELTLKVCAAAAYLHGRSFIHRDIKPEHILLTAEGRVVLIDLDTSMRILPGKKNDTQLLGTAMYAAPEQFGLTRSDERTDIYALGILMNEMLTGEHPAVIRYQEGPLAEIIERCIRMNPAERYQTAEELERALQNLAVPLTVKKRKKPAVWLACIILCAAIGMFALMPQQETSSEYLPLYGDKSHQYDLYYNFRIGSQSRSLYTDTNMLIDQTWKVYADSNVGDIEGWDTRYEGWTVNSEGCNIGETGYIHAEKNGKHYAIPVLVQGEPMSAYADVPSKKDLAEGYLKPEEEPGFPYPGVVNLSYNPEEAVTIYLAAMEGFYHLQPECDSGLVTIEPYEGAEDWNLPVFTMTFRNPEGGDVQLKVESNCTPLQFRFTETG